MEILELNETPVRTAKNFNINSVRLENVSIPQELSEFKNVTVKYDHSKVQEDIEVSPLKLEYGLNDELTQQFNEKSNKKLRLTVNEKTNEETEIIFRLDDKENLNLVDNIEIIADENSKATIIIKYEVNQNIENYHNGIIRVQAKKGSCINVIIANFINTISNNFMSIQNVIEENAKLNYTIIDFGGKNSITNYYSNIIGDAAENKLNTIYLGKEKQLFDLNYIGELRGKKSKIDIEVQGALKDNAKKHFKGTIDFKKGCKKAKGNENDECMLLSNESRSLSLPMLLCSEEEVEGNHSSSAGKIGDKELFYIMSRGFDIKEAMKLMVRAKFNKILESIGNEKLREQISDEINKRLE